MGSCRCGRRCIETRSTLGVYELAEKLVDLEDWFQQWRFRHMKTVERIIGFKRGREALQEYRSCKRRCRSGCSLNCGPCERRCDGRTRSARRRADLWGAFLLSLALQSGGASRQRWMDSFCRCESIAHDLDWECYPGYSPGYSVEGPDGRAYGKFGLGMSVLLAPSVWVGRVLSLGIGPG